MDFHAYISTLTPGRLPDVLLSAERVRWLYVQWVLERCGGNVSETARRLGLHRRSLQRKLGKNCPR